MIKIRTLEESIPVYDITVDGNHNFYANGLLVHNCAEIFQYTDEKSTAICTLSSMVLKNFVNEGKFDFKLLSQEVKRVTRALNKVIDINSYTTKKGEKGGHEQRAIAIGVQGLADVFFLMDYDYTSNEAKQLNKNIFETIYHAAITESCKLCEEGVHKPYKFFKGSPMSKGVFQFDMWGLGDGELSGMWDWEKLKKSVMEHGVCNSLLTAQMPVACQTKEARIRTENGVKSLEELLVGAKIDVNQIEKDDIGGIWHEFESPIMVETMNGLQESKRAYYSGTKDAFSIEMEDGSQFECSENHMFLVRTESGNSWKTVSELSEGDDIVNIFEQQASEQKNYAIYEHDSTYN